MDTGYPGAALRVGPGQVLKVITDTAREMDMGTVKIIPGDLQYHLVQVLEKNLPSVLIK